jgi:hypothetical protein
VLRFPARTQSPETLAVIFNYTLKKEQMKEQELFDAIRKGKIENVKQLLNDGVRTNLLDEDKNSFSLGMTPLHLAIFRAGGSQKEVFKDIVELLLESKANIEYLNYSGEPPIFLL